MPAPQKNPDDGAPVTEPDVTRPRILAPKGVLTLDGLHKWAPWLASFLLFVISTTAAAVLIYAMTKNDLANLRVELAAARNDVADLRANGTQKTRDVERDLGLLRARVEAEATTRKELLDRMKSVEKLLARLVCKQDGVNSPACDAAMASIGQ